MKMTLLARNVIAKLILRSLISLLFVLGLSKPVAVQVAQDTQLQSSVASSSSPDEYWKYYLDCDRWGVVLATPSQFETIVKATPKESTSETIKANVVAQNSTNQNSIIDTPPTAQIAVHDKLQKPAEERQSVIEFFMSLDAPLLDDLDLLMLAAEVELQPSNQAVAVAMSPFRTASHSRIVYPATELHQPELVVAELAKLELEMGAPVFPGIGLELPAVVNQDQAWDDFWGEIFEFGEESAEWFTPDGCQAEAEVTSESAASSEMPIDQSAGLPTIALAMSNAVLKSTFWASPSASLDEMTAILHFRFGQTLLYRMGLDVLFNARSEFELANQKPVVEKPVVEKPVVEKPVVARPAMSDSEAVEYSRQFAGNLSWLSLQLHKAAISVSRSADSRAANIGQNLK